MHKATHFHPHISPPTSVGHTHTIGVAHCLLSVAHGYTFYVVSDEHDPFSVLGPKISWNWYGLLARIKAQVSPNTF